MKKLFLFTCQLFISHFIFSQGTWTQKVSLPAAARREASGFSIGNKGYICDGWNGAAMRDLWEWDPSTNTWTQKADFGGGVRQGTFHFVIGTKAYVGLGYDAFTAYPNDFWEWDQTTNVWTSKAPLPATPREDGISFSIGGKGYIGLGYNYQNATHLYKDFWEYDTTANSWTRKADFPGAARAWGPVYFSIGTKGYAGLGYNQVSAFQDFYEYDQPTDTWTQKANFGGGVRNWTAHFALCGRGYVGTGNDNGDNGANHNDFWKYIPLTDTWTPQTNFGGVPRYACAFFAMDANSKGYVGTGSLTAFGNWFTDFWEFTPDSACSSTPTAHFAPTDTTFCGEAGGCVNFLDFSTGNPYAWKWYFPNAIPDSSSLQNPPNVCFPAPGTYAVTLIVTNASGTDTLTISPMVIVGSPPTPPTISCSHDTLYSSTGLLYQWYLNGFPIAGATDSSHFMSASGTYAVRITDSLGCSSISNGTGSCITGIKALQSEIPLVVSPIPADNILTIYGGGIEENTLFSLYNILGEEIKDNLPVQAKSSEAIINIQSLPPGIYLLHITGKNGTVVKKVVKR